MADPFDDIDPGQDFEDYAAGLAPVTVEQVDGDDGVAITTVEDVPATKLIRRRSPFAVGGGSVGGDVTEFVFRANRLGWLPKEHDRITDASGTVWAVESAALEAFDALCRAQVHVKR